LRHLRGNTASLQPDSAEAKCHRLWRAINIFHSLWHSYAATPVVFPAIPNPDWDLLVGYAPKAVASAISSRKDFRERLWAYLGGIAREHEMKALAVGGTDDHVHILLSLPATKAVSQAMREIKQGSSRWMHETCGVPEFAWQEGYGAFSVGMNQVNTTIAYIAGQQEHHRKRDFQAEYVAFLRKHRIDYDPRYVWG
jgi:putative transposase